MPEYEVKRWSFENFPRGRSRWVDEAFDAGKYAFCADYIRNYALYHEGGIYLDSDVEAVRDLEPLLGLPYFFGRERSSEFIEAAVIGAEKGNPLFKAALDWYDSHDFKQFAEEGFPWTMPRLYGQIIAESGLKMEDIVSPKEFQDADGVLCVYPEDFFSPKDYATGLIHLTERTYAIHHFSCSWVDQKSLSFKLHLFKNWLIKVVGPKPVLAVANLLNRRNGKG